MDFSTFSTLFRLQHAPKAFFMAPSGTLSSATNVITNQAPVVMADGQFNDGYVSISAYLGPTRSPRSGTVTTCTCRGAPEAIGAPSHHLFLLAEALRKPWITPIGQNRRKWRAFPRGSEIHPNPAKLPRIGRAERLAILDHFGQSARSIALRGPSRANWHEERVLRSPWARLCTYIYVVGPSVCRSTPPR